MRLLSTFLSQIVNGLVFGSLIGLIALGYTMVYGIIELINFAHGDLFMLATIVAAALLVSVMGVGNLTAASILPLLVAMVVCMAFGAGVNMAAERLAYRRLRSAPKLAPVITKRVMPNAASSRNRSAHAAGGPTIANRSTNSGSSASVCAALLRRCTLLS